MKIRRAFTHPFDNYVDRVVISVFQALAIIMTLARLARRIRISRFSWDDAWAVVSLIIFTVQTASEWVRMALREDRESMTPSVYQKKIQLFLSLGIGLFTAAVWTSRISLCLSIVRILPPSRLRRTALMLSVACFVFGSIITPIKSALCNLEFLSQYQTIMSCRGGITIFVTQVAGDIISSAILVVFPLYALRITSSNLPADERRLIYLLMTGTLLTLGACLAQSFYVIRRDPFGMTYSAKIEGAVALMVCNLLVVATSIHRLFTRCQRSGDQEGGEGEEEEYNSGEKSIGITTAADSSEDWSNSISSLSSDTASTGFPSQLTELNDSLSTISNYPIDPNNPPDFTTRPAPTIVVSTTGR
ncbi:hypothetical protein E1B28_009691 [Marasmius oreades]|uniref:Integral membrane protein n=1 Tax=Marasmius oreades TaxID=181124 RepID=A0A9P7RVT2_9AGAR|nr:uncharacterized protein E1B28_009691 [Marasmius oreades]KAG7090585.1 hypothetical protein E1B28_009691 [Marasmius oreades]